MKCLWRIIVVLTTSGVILGGLWLLMQIMPAQLKPWVPFTIQQQWDDEIRQRWLELADQPRSCLSILAESAPQETMLAAVEDHQAPPDCTLSNVVLVHRTTLELNQQQLIQCPLLVAWLMFEQQQLQPLAQQFLQQEVTAVRMFSSFSCRNIYNRPKAKRSQHAHAAALDIGGFTLADEEKINVQKHWSDEGPKGQFLRALHSAACGYFGTVLGPDYNAAHYNHFHLDSSITGLCR